MIIILINANLMQFFWIKLHVRVNLIQYNIVTISCRNAWNNICKDCVWIVK